MYCDPLYILFADKKIGQSNDATPLFLCPKLKNLASRTTREEVNVKLLKFDNKQTRKSSVLKLRLCYETKSTSFISLLSKQLSILG